MHKGGVSWALAFALFLAAAACGVSLAGTGSGVEAADASADGAISPSLPGDGLTDATPGNAGDTGAVDAATTDGSRDDLCDAACETTAGGHCDGGTCFIVCTGKNSCKRGPSSDRPHCPDGMACDIECADDGCSDGVDCNDASSCTINCKDKDSCGGGDHVECGDGKGGTSRCDITCAGEASCKNGVSCGANDCFVKCTGANACAMDVSATGVGGTRSATVDCTGDASCKGNVKGGGNATIHCASDSCEQKKVQCGTGGGSSCTATCEAGSCSKGVCCPSGTAPCLIDPPDAMVGDPCP